MASLGSFLKPIWLARLLIGVVLFFNVQSVSSFWLYPQRYAPAYELFGVVGIAVIRGFAVLFLMWNVPYVIAFWHPFRRLISLGEAVVMQTIGLAGESWILNGLPQEHAILRDSILRFILFDAFGLILLVTALGVVYYNRSKSGDYP